ncbi:DUF58 domain-containing protein [Spirulina subsalsa]|uniref:DUF58 domain-containing protein n=1 Tax=Spirulina subsalsa TaxID=54311 RepID=UPI0002DD570A|nr:DUF58 domain-containing protein [Spirulina subsalsa]
MKITRRLHHWLEQRWAAPAYSGGILLTLALCFFGAATNTMAGWLYAISGLILALLGLSILLSMRNLSQLKVRRFPITPVTVGDELAIELELENPTLQPKLLLQVWDQVPPPLQTQEAIALEVIPPQTTQRCTAYYQARKRGVYRWQNVDLRTASPLGLFWCRRSHSAPGKAIVYPTVLPLTYCPLVESLGQDDTLQIERDRRYQSATQGITKALRPYRLGDPTRLIHWRTSARLGILQVRELEMLTSGQEVVICLDTQHPWDPDSFEQAVTATASLYFYASRAQLAVKLWTAKTGLVQGNHLVLETLAATSPQEERHGDPPQNVPLVWLTSSRQTLQNLPTGSCYVLFPDPLAGTIAPILQSTYPGLVIDPEKGLQQQLQRRIC